MAANIPVKPTDALPLEPYELETPGRHYDAPINRYARFEDRRGLGPGHGVRVVARSLPGAPRAVGGTLFL